MRLYIIKLILIVILILSIVYIYSGIPSASPKPSFKQFVIIKADDLRYNNTFIHPRWIKFFEYIDGKNIKASVGIVGIALEIENTEEEINNFVDTYLKNTSKRNTFELWNHGYMHNLDLPDKTGTNISEFGGTTYEYQKEHLLKTQYLAKEKLNLTMHTFGAPYGKEDVNTIRTIEEIPDIKVLFSSGNPVSEKLLILKRGYCEIEKGKPAIPDYEGFVNDYNSLKCDKRDYLVLQVHPDKWNDESFKQFDKIIDFLIEQNVTFINPYEYYQLLNDSGEIEQ